MNNRLTLQTARRFVKSIKDKTASHNDACGYALRIIRAITEYKTFTWEELEIAREELTDLVAKIRKHKAASE